MYIILNYFSGEPLPVIKGDDDNQFEDLEVGETLRFGTRKEAKEYAEENLQSGYWKIIKEN